MNSKEIANIELYGKTARGQKELIKHPIRYRTPDVMNFMEARPITFNEN